jgi:hypothetical protein
VGSGVWIEFEAGDVSKPIWTGCFWFAGQVPSAADPAVKSVITTAGSLAFDTGAGSITTTGTQSQTITVDSSGVTLTAGSGAVAVGASGVSVNNGALEVT